MIKRVIPAILLFFLVMRVSAQNLPVNEKTGKVTFLEVVDAKGMTGAELYKALNEWLISKGFTEKSKEDNSFEAVYTGMVPLDYTSAKPGKNDKGKVNFTFSVFCKDGKYRFIVTDFVHEGLEGAANGGKLENVTPDCGKGGMVPGNWVSIKNKTQGEINNWVKEVKKYVLEIQNDPAKNKDW